MSGNSVSGLRLWAQGDFGIRNRTVRRQGNDRKRNRCSETGTRIRGKTSRTAHAAVSFATGKLDSNPASFTHEIAAQIERIYRGVYLLATLQRDEVIRNGRQKELEKIIKAASESQASIRDEALTTTWEKRR